MTLIRSAQLADVPAIARVHVESWRTTYPGLMPAELLANLSVERRENFWQSVLENPQAQTFLHVAEDSTHGIIGFSAAGPERSEHPVYKGELYAIYLLQEQQGKGAGRALFQAASKQLVERGFNTMLLWVLKGNPAIQFYERLGGIRVAEKTENFNDAPLTEFAYGWDNLQTVIKT